MPQIRVAGRSDVVTEIGLKNNISAGMKLAALGIYQLLLEYFAGKINYDVVHIQMHYI